MIEHLWLTTRPDAWRSMVLRMSWDGADEAPAVAVPLGDFFCQGWAEFAPLVSEPMVVAPHGGMNCYFPMPFRKSARISIENLGPGEQVVYYQVDYALGEIPDDLGYLHATWRRANPVPAGEVFTILDGAAGRGSYVGTYLAVGVNSPGWWGEGEVKFFLDDESLPDDLRDGHGGLLRRGLGLRGPRAGVLDVLVELPRAAPGHPARTACTVRRPASACTAGTFPTRSTSSAS